MRKFTLLLMVFLVLLFMLFSVSEATPIRVGVAEFVDKTDSISSVLLIPFTETFMKYLAESSNNIEVVSSKSFQLYHTKADENYVSAGKSEHCEYLILGALVKYQGSSNTIDVKLIEVKTGDIVLSVSGVGKAPNLDSTQKAVSFQEQMEDFENSRNATLSSAASMAAEKICAYLTGEYPKVSSLQSVTQNKKKSKSKKSKDSVLGTINIDKGTLSGIHENMFFKIFFEGEEVFDFNGSSLGHEKFNVAVAKVKKVRTDYCTAEVIGGIFTNIRNDDKAEQITEEEAMRIIADNDFSKNRLAEFLN